MPQYFLRHPCCVTVFGSHAKNSLLLRIITLENNNVIFFSTKMDLRDNM